MSDATVVVELVDGGRGVRLVSAGPVTGEAFVQVHEAVLDAEPGSLEAVRYWFSDHSRLDAVNLYGADAAAVSDVGRRLRERMPDLVIVNMAFGDLEFGILRMWEAFSADHGWPSAIVRRTEEVRPALKALLGEAADPLTSDVLRTLARFPPTPQA